MTTPEIGLTCTALQELQVRRRFLIKLQTKQTNALGALARRYLGWKPDLPEADRAKIARQALRLTSAALAGKPPSEDDAEVAAHLGPDIAVVGQALLPLEKRRNEIEREMQRLARTLPAYPFAKSVHGFGDKAFAIIVGEAGNLSKYPNEKMLWKRLGLAPYEGKAASTWRTTKGGLSGEEWTGLGYSPARRAEIFAAIDSPLFRLQTPIEGPYRKIYDARRARTGETHSDWSKAHSHNDALRVMTKALIADLWRAWHDEGKPEALAA